MDKHCGNCGKRDDCRKCNWGIACEEWTEEKRMPTYEELARENTALKSRLARYQPRLFDPEDKGTWPDDKKLVIIFDTKGFYHFAYWARNWLGWANQKGCVNPELKAVWWSYLSWGGGGVG